MGVMFILERGRSRGNDELMAHELTHVVQQGGGVQTKDDKPQNEAISSQSITSFEGLEAIQAKEPNPQPGPRPPGFGEKNWRISVPNDPGWISLESGTIGGFHIPGAPVELPHTMALRSMLPPNPDGIISVDILEGRYKNKGAEIKSSVLVPFSAINTSATVKFVKGKRGIGPREKEVRFGKFYYASQGPIEAITDITNEVPNGTHDLQIPDFQHTVARGYCDYDTTWFRIANQSDRYLHPGAVSHGCATIVQTSEWPNIWRYLIHSRKDDQNVGKLIVE